MSKSRTLSVADSARVFLRAEELFPKFPQTQPTIHARHTFRYRWLFLALAVLSLCAISQAQLPPVPLPPSPWFYQIHGGESFDDITPLIHNLCWAENAPGTAGINTGYDTSTFPSVMLLLTTAKCSQLTYPNPKPPSATFYQSLADCKKQQTEYFGYGAGVGGDPDAFYYNWKVAESVVALHPEVCTAAFKAAPAYVSPFTIPYNVDGPYPNPVYYVPQ